MQVDVLLHFNLLVSSRAQMALRIEKSSQGKTTTIRLIGRVQAEHLDALNSEIRSSQPPITLDLGEVSLVDVEVVRFLGACQVKNLTLTGCSRYIRHWISIEVEREQ